MGYFLEEIRGRRAWARRQALTNRSKCLIFRLLIGGLTLRLGLPIGIIMNFPKKTQFYVNLSCFVLVNFSFRRYNKNMLSKENLEEGDIRRSGTICSSGTAARRELWGGRA